jgi:hypothetical protein
MPTIADIKEELKSLGVKGYSGKNKQQLEEMLNNAKRTAVVNSTPTTNPVDDMVRGIIREINEPNISKKKLNDAEKELQAAQNEVKELTMKLEEAKKREYRASMALENAQFDVRLAEANSPDGRLKGADDKLKEINRLTAAANDPLYDDTYGTGARSEIISELPIYREQYKNFIKENKIKYNTITKKHFY